MGARPTEGVTMARIAEAAETFLQARTIAVTGVSREPKGEASNGI